MDLTKDKAARIREYIGELYSAGSDKEFLETAVPRAAEMLDIDYYAFLLFPNLLTREMLYVSNNPSGFTREYVSHLKDRDSILQFMIENGNITSPLSAVLPPEKRRTDLFYNECDKLRPAGDGAYIPLIVDGQLAGFTGMVRASDNPAPLREDELFLIQFLISFWPDAIRRSQIEKDGDDCLALLDHQGVILKAGDEIGGLLKERFGISEGFSLRHWPDASGIELINALRSFSGLSPARKIVLGQGQRTTMFQLSNISEGRLRRYLPGLPCFELRLLHSGNSDLPFNPKLVSKYCFSPRELDIIGLVYHGCTNREIGTSLGIRESTVKHHVYNIFNKAGVDSRTQLIFGLSGSSV